MEHTLVSCIKLKSRSFLLYLVHIARNQNSEDADPHVLHLDCTTAMQKVYHTASTAAEHVTKHTDTGDTD